MKALDDANFACRIIVDIHKVFYTVDQNMLLKELDRYGRRRIPNKWFKSYFANFGQLV